MAGDTGSPESEDRADNLVPFVRKLRTEIRSWEEDGIISAEQSTAILGLYDVTPESPARIVPSRVVSVIAVMGAALVGLGIIAAVAANWSAIPLGTKLVMMAVGVPALYFAGWLLIQRWGFIRIGTAIILLGAISFGASIHLIAQIYHVPVDSPNLMAAWFLGVIPVAYITRSKALATLAVVLFFAAAGFRSQVWLRAVGDELFFLLIPILLALAAALFAVGRAQSRFAFTRPIAGVFTAIAMIAASGSVYVLGFQDVWSSLEPWSVESARLEYWIVLSGALITVGGSSVVARWRSGGGHMSLIWWELLAPLAMIVVATGTLVGLIWGLTWMWAVMNALLLIGVIVSVYAGYRWKRSDLVNLAIAIFGITLITRYFEFGFSLLQQSVAFIVAGVIMLALGLGLEWFRRRMLVRMRRMETAR